MAVRPAEPPPILHNDPATHGKLSATGLNCHSQAFLQRKSPVLTVVDYFCEGYNLGFAILPIRLNLTTPHSLNSLHFESFRLCDLSSRTEFVRLRQAKN